MKRVLSLILLGAALCGCSATVNGQARFRTTVGFIQSHCSSLLGKEVVIEGIYKGWDCPPDCPNPGNTRSDACVFEGKSCIYLLGTGGLDPLKDLNKRVRVKGIVEQKNGICYLKAVEVNEL